MATALGALLALMLIAPAGALADASIATMPSFGGKAVAPGDTLDGAATATGTPQPDVTYQWLRCNPGTTTCSNIPFETNATYKATSSDVGSELAVLVTADNHTDPAVNQTSDHTGTVADPPPPTTPPAVTKPTISGNTVVGQILTASATATGNPQPAITYAWERCAGSACTAAGTGDKYTLTNADAGKTMRVTASADNGTGSPDSKQSDQTGVVTSPATVTKPTISGSTSVGGTLTASATSGGNPPPSVTYQWQRCNTGGGGCGNIGSPATGNTYVLQAADAGNTIRVIAQADNGVATPDSKQSDATAVVSAPPQFTAGPSVVGDAVVGHVLTVSATAVGPPDPTPTYQWQRCAPDGNSCGDIAGATAAKYTVQPADAGNSLRVTATANNGVGQPAVKQSDATAGVTAAPQIDPAPTISGNAVVGQTLKAAALASGTPTPTITFRWQRCGRNGEDCSNITGANDQTYTLRDADLNHTVRVVATATNGTLPDDTRRSSETAVVRAASVAASSGTQSFDTTTSTSPEPAPLQANGQPAVQFPKVRIRGKLVNGGVKITMFAVLAPQSWRVEVSCSGKGCPAKDLALTTKNATTRLRSLERVMRVGTRIVVRISRPGATGKYSSFVIRANAAPKRRDLCLAPNSKKAVRCVA